MFLTHGSGERRAAYVRAKSAFTTRFRKPSGAAGGDDIAAMIAGIAARNAPQHNTAANHFGKNLVPRITIRIPFSLGHGGIADCRLRIAD
jgi:hypothetical protein